MKARSYGQNYQERTNTYYNVLIGNILNSNDLSPQQKAKLIQFKEYKESEGCRVRTIYGYVKTLLWMARKVKKPFEEYTEQDIRQYLAGKKDKTGVVSITKSTARQFFTKKIGLQEIAKDIKLSSPESPVFDSKEILTPADVKLLVENAISLRDKILILIMYDSAARIDEILNTKIKDYTPNEHGVNMFIKVSKTTKRNIQLIEAAPDVVEYLNKHPLKNNPEAPMFYTEKPFGQPLGYGGIRKILKNTVERAGFKKKYNAHWFRHSKLTLEAQDLTDAQLRIFAGWGKSSKMSGRYTHLSDDDVTKMRLAKRGLIDKDGEEAKDKSLANLKCPRCQTMNSAMNDYCMKCWQPLSKKAFAEKENKERNKLESLKESIIKDLLMKLKKTKV